MQSRKKKNKDQIKKNKILNNGSIVKYERVNNVHNLMTIKKENYYRWE
jgi:hypothetical protein